jgi:multiple sugar transport system permease protein
MHRWLRWLGTVMAGILSLLWIGPIVLVVFSAMKDPVEQAREGLLSLPDQPGTIVDNAREAIDLAGMGAGFVNSLLYAAVGAFLAMILSSLGAYALIKLRIRGSFLLFLLIYCGTVFPSQMFLIPLFRTYLSLNLYDTRTGMILFYTTVAIPFCLFVFRNFFLAFPDDVIEAGALDGASPLRTYLNIVLPMSKAPAMVVFLTQFTWIWNDLLFGQVLAKSDDVRPIMPSLALLSGQYGVGSIPQVMAGALLASVPTLALFLLLQRHFMAGLGVTTIGE